MLPTLERLHNLRRNALGEQGVFQCHRFATFHRHVTRELLLAEKLWLSIVTWDGEPIAAEYQVRQEDRLFAYQSGILPHAKVESPGSLSLLMNIRAAMEHGIHEIDFLRGDESYKSRWGATAVPTMELRIRRPESTNRLYHAAWRTTERASQYLRGWGRLPA
jgi:CelD/BcsL family acetyltransferase involved in cellulose biosynthesis